jgi:hypothetical protein
VSALLALVLAAAPGCPVALAAADVPADDLASRALALVEALDQAGAGGPTAALAASARAAAAAAPAARDAAVAAFRGALARHCALASLPAVPEASAADRAALAEVLARPELAQARSDPDALRRALLRLWDWIVELLGTEEAERYASLGRALFLGVAAAALVLVLAGLRRRSRERGTAGRGAAAGPASPVPEADESAARAEEALRSGDGPGAVRYALLAALGALERAGAVPRGRALTNEEVVAIATSTSTPEGESPAPSIIASDLGALAGAFDRAVYGGLPVAPEEARTAVERARRIARSAGATA